MSMIDTLIERARRYCREHRISTARFEREAGVGVNTLVRLHDPNWDPRASTLRKIEAVLPDADSAA